MARKPSVAIINLINSNIGSLMFLCLTILDPILGSCSSLYPPIVYSNMHVAKWHSTVNLNARRVGSSVHSGDLMRQPCWEWIQERIHISLRLIREIHLKKLTHDDLYRLHT